MRSALPVHQICASAYTHEMSEIRSKYPLHPQKIACSYLHGVKNDMIDQGFFLRIMLGTQFGFVGTRFLWF